jgi:hypothetical protein
MKAAAQGGTAVMNSSWEGPREGAAGALYGARRPDGHGGVGPLVRRRNFNPLRMRSLYGAVRRPPPFILR